MSTDIDDLDAFKKSGKSCHNEFSEKLQFGARVMTLTSVLESSNSPNNIDFISLDVEGSELAVLSGLDFDRYRIKYLLVECRNFHRLESFLKQFGYKFLEKLSYHDYLFTRKD